MNTTDTPTFTAINRGTGEVEIHLTGCQDLKRGVRGASIWQVNGWTHEEVIRDVFSDMIDSGESTVEDCWEGVHYARCAGAVIPKRSTDTEAAPAQRTRTAQADIITAFLTAHRGTAYTPHQISTGTGHKGLRDACKRLAAAGTIEQASDKPVSYRIA